ncbi:MAG: bifunctional hydroxymethylpyrimidine kinase/phosphomethylpyrimidine kinase [Acidaminococcaceae bacterium]|nr:bifunctional hydroxymethylpyrimidine kinase/phosphomethylpyrimidine kinase [Acidaminococcaceae bacterium]
MKNLLTIAGSDSSGGAGIQADLKTFAAHKTYGMSVITAVTAQNTMGVLGVQNISPRTIQQQLQAVFEDVLVDGVKIGMLSTATIIRTVARSLTQYQPKIMVLDPVMVSKSGHNLLDPKAVQILIKELLPLAMVVTPNIPEAEVITSQEIRTRKDMETAAKDLCCMGAKYVLLKGGHGSGAADDVLYDSINDRCTWFGAERVNTIHTHGTGCSLSSAIAANLSNGMPIEEAVAEAKKYVLVGIKHGLAIGGGHGPIHHFVEMWKDR